MSSPGDDLSEQDEGLVKSCTAGRLDWEQLRRLSLNKGGFGVWRTTLWPLLLHAGHPKESERSNHERQETPLESQGADDVKAEESTSVEEALNISHSDERQIKLDTDRSFVLYPGYTRRDRLQADLNELIMTVFRKHPKFHYFQGYHDIITVLFLTLRKDDQVRCAEKLSIHRLRDSLRNGLEPMQGLLRITQNLIRAADPEYAALIESNIPLPYFALSNLLTLFSHDVPTLSQIQHIFDFLFARPPIMSVYLAVAVILTRRDEAKKLEEEGEDGMLHSLLSNFPSIDEGERQEKDKMPVETRRSVSQETVERTDSSESETAADDESSLSLLDEPQERQKPDESSLLAALEDSSMTDSSTYPISYIPSMASWEETDQETTVVSSSASSTVDVDSEEDEKVVRYAEVDVQTPIAEQPPTEEPPKPTHPQLVTVLQHADELYAQYPPTHSAIDAQSIMGPHSVIFTWTEDAQDDEDAEALLDSALEKVVLPYEEPVPEPLDTEIRIPRRRVRRRFKSITLGRRQLLVGGIVLAVSIVLAYYGMRGLGKNHKLVSFVNDVRQKWRELTPGWFKGSLTRHGEL